LELPGRPLVDERQSVAEELRTVDMMWEREAIRFFRTRARVLPSLIQPVLFLFVLGYGMGTLDRRVRFQEVPVPRDRGP
jgi:hypothetical protein